ncbi:MAG: YHS domain-containing (seleno)protein [Tepidisphaeraceae bacterium]
MRLASLLLVVLVCVVSAVSFAGEAPTKIYVNQDWWGTALKGYDPVAYFTDGAPKEGDKSITASYQGATYRFTSVEHRQLFEKEPPKYAPQFGGFCAFAVSKGYTANIDPNAWDIVDGRLILQYSLDVREQFRKDTSGNLAKADANWPRIRDENGKPAE